MPRKAQPIVERFWKTVDKRQNCWLWKHAKTPQGYGSFKLPMPNRKDVAAHRFSWELHYGPIPRGLFVCHRCDVKACVRPDHLFIGSAQANSTDMVQKGRAAKGPRNGNNKLTEQDVRKIRELRGQLSQRQLAKLFNVTQPQIGYIHRREQWTHL